MENALQLTGNPFVDSGLAIMAHLAGRSDVSELSFADLKTLVGDASALARNNARLKSYTMVFGTNGVLTQPAYKKAGNNEIIYKAIVTRFVAGTEKEGRRGAPCELTGIPTTFDFHEACVSALAEAGQNIPDRKWIGRDWVPLAGSLGNDAQALPAASRPLHVSATALLALQYLPAGVFLYEGRLACYQCTHAPLVQQLTADVVEHNRERVLAGNLEMLGKGEGSGVLLEGLLRRFERLLEAREDFQLPRNTALFVWLFKNSGTSVDCGIVEVPDLVLHFLWDAAREGFGSEIRRLVAGESKDPRSRFLSAIREGRDYRGLYPFKKWAGTSQEFYEFYQRRVCGRSGRALGVARQLAHMVHETSSPKTLQALRKPDAFSQMDSTGRNAVRGLIAGKLDLTEYDTLFPSAYHPIRVRRDDWNPIRFYLSQSKVPDIPLEDGEPMSTTHPKVVLIADEYFRSRGRTRVKGLLEQLKRGKAGLRWLQDVFCEMAETHREFGLGEWDEFVCNEEGRPVPYELLFQVRLRLSNLYRQSTEEKELAE